MLDSHAQSVLVKELASLEQNLAHRNHHMRTGTKRSSVRHNDNSQMLVRTIGKLLTKGILLVLLYIFSEKYPSTELQKYI